MYDMNTGEFRQLEPKFGVGMAVVNAINSAGIAVRTIIAFAKPQAGAS